MKFMKIPIFLGVFLAIVGLEILLICNYFLGIILLILALVVECLENKRVWPIHDGFDPVCNEQDVVVEMICYKNTCELAFIFILFQIYMLILLSISAMYFALFLPILLIGLAIGLRKEMLWRYILFKQYYICHLS